jgi:hypothetical protein
VIRKLAIVVLILSAVALAQSSAEGKYQSKLENDVVAVYQIDLAPHASAAVFQSAHDTFWLSLNDANVSFARSSSGTVDIEFRPGDTRFFSSFETKLLTNTGNTEFRGVMIALKARGLTNNGCECTGSTGKTVCGCKGGTHLESLWALSVGNVTLAGTTLAAGEAFRSAALRDDMLLVAVTDLDLQDEAKGGATESESYTPAIHLKPGDAAWVAGGRHQFKNMGSGAARFVTLEF